MAKEDNLRIGHGYDAHALVAGRRLIIGGVDIAHDTGLLGHSDADVLAHAIIDALIGAAGLGDIGAHFPASDAKYKNISSMTLASKTAGLLKEAGFEIINIDSTVVCETPRLAPFIPEMTAAIAKALGIDSGRVNVKAKTEEGMGFTGKKEGIAAHSVAMVRALK